jgi:hypothetical protein
MPAIAMILEGLGIFFNGVIRIFTLLRTFFAGISKLIASYWPKIVSALPAIFMFFIDHIMEAMDNWLADGMDKIAEKIDSAETLPFPSIPTLSSVYYSVDPELLQWLEAFRVGESLGVVSSVVAWKYGKDIVSRIIGKIS